jgi:hypothetical protein
VVVALTRGATPATEVALDAHGERRLPRFGGGRAGTTDLPTAQRASALAGARDAALAECVPAGANHVRLAPDVHADAADEVLIGRRKRHWRRGCLGGLSHVVPYSKVRFVKWRGNPKKKKNKYQTGSLK